MQDPLAIKDCTLVALATGERAQNLRELRDGLAVVPDESIYYHFWGRLLRPRFDDPEYHSDFASWARHDLHDELLSERLAVVDPADFSTVDDLRQELIEVVEVRLEETPPAWSRPDRQFHFRLCQTVVFDTGRRVHAPEELVAILPTLSLGSIYYHVIDARRRAPQHTDDFRAWLLGLDGDHPLAARLEAIDPYFSTLAELRAQIASESAAYASGVGA